MGFGRDVRPDRVREFAKTRKSGHMFRWLRHFGQWGGCVTVGFVGFVNKGRRDRFADLVHLWRGRW